MIVDFNFIQIYLIIVFVAKKIKNILK